MKSMTWNRITSLAIAAAASLSAVVYAVPQDGTCPDCCGARPPFVATISAPFNPGLLSAVTNFQTDPNAPAVYVIDLGNQGAAPIGTPWLTQRYSAPSWTMGKLGGVFGVTLDDVGNVYVGQTSVYGTGTGSDVLGTLGGAGSIYLLNGVTGAASELIRLPNNIDPLIVLNNPLEAYPGLGNLTFDCSSKRLYAANLEDGRIYTIDPNGGATKVRSTYNIFDGVITGPLPNNALAEPGDLPGWEPLRKLPYALKVNGNRLYYSVWNGTLNTGSANTIRSVQLNGSGDFMAGTDQLEIVMPPYPNSQNSNVVADITFDDDCCLYAAERGINFINSSAHSSRVIKFCPSAAAGFGAPFTYQIGHNCTGNNSAGGVGFEPGVVDKMWSMGDAINLCNPTGGTVYGLQGQPVTGAPYTASLLVDVDGYLNQQQKNDLGSLEVNCMTTVPPCARIVDGEILCKEDGSFTYTFTITNQSGQTAAVLILPDPAFTPNVFPLNPPLPNGSSTTITVNLNGPLPGSQFCFPIILGSVTGQVCCHMLGKQEHCVQLPECECAQISKVVQTMTATSGTFILNFTMTNLSAWNMGHLTIFPTGATGTINPELVNVPSTPMWGSQVIGPITVTSGAAPGSQFCITIGNHSMDWMQCCFIELCVTVMTPLPSWDPADLNHDGNIDAADITILLGSWGSGATGDINGDDNVDAMDLTLLLGSWGS